MEFRDLEKFDTATTDKKITMSLAFATLFVLAFLAAVIILDSL